MLMKGIMKIIAKYILSWRHLKWRQRPDMIIAVDWDVKQQTCTK